MIAHELQRCPHCLTGFLYDDRYHREAPQDPDTHHCLNCGRNVRLPELGTEPEPSRKRQWAPKHGGQRL